MGHSVFISTFPVSHLIKAQEENDPYMGHIVVPQPGHGFSKLDVVYHDGSSPFALAQADAEATIAWGMVGRVIDANSFELVYNGVITAVGHGLGSGGDALYLDQSTAGDTTTTLPSSGIVQQVGLVHSADYIYVQTQQAVWS